MASDEDQIFTRELISKNRVTVPPAQITINDIEEGDLVTVKILSVRKSPENLAKRKEGSLEKSVACQ